MIDSIGLGGHDGPLQFVKQGAAMANQAAQQVEQATATALAATEAAASKAEHLRQKLDSSV